MVSRRGFNCPVKWPVIWGGICLVKRSSHTKWVSFRLVGTSSSSSQLQPLTTTLLQGLSPTLVSGYWRNSKEEDDTPSSSAISSCIVEVASHFFGCERISRTELWWGPQVAFAQFSLSFGQTITSSCPSTKLIVYRCFGRSKQLSILSAE